MITNATGIHEMSIEQQREHCHQCFRSGYGNCKKCALNAVIMPCDQCGQKLSDKGIGGEYPCSLCGIPTVHDEYFTAHPEGKE